MNKYIGFFRMKIERRARWDKVWLPLDILLRYVEDVYWRIKGFTVIECFGDSHVKVMRRLNWAAREHDLRFRTISVMGATAYGVVNYGSRSGARETYEKRLKNINKNNKALVMLGEIDAGFLIWSLAKKKGLSVEAVLKETVDRYVRFLSYVKNMCNDVYVCSAPLPTVDDGEKDPGYLEVRGSIQVSKKERTDMTLKFNETVQKSCKLLDIIYVDLDDLSIDKTTGLVKRSLINPSGLDHHYEENAFINILQNRMLQMNIIRGRL